MIKLIKFKKNTDILSVKQIRQNKMMSVSFWMMHNIKINYACIDNYRCDETSIVLQIEWENKDNNDNKIIFYDNREDFFKNVDEFMWKIKDNC